MICIYIYNDEIVIVYDMLINLQHNCVKCMYSDMNDWYHVAV